MRDSTSTLQSLVPHALILHGITPAAQNPAQIKVSLFRFCGGYGAERLRHNESTLSPR